jgi:hypothetical protein
MSNCTKNRRSRRFFGLGGCGSGATLAEPGPVGGVVAGDSVAAERVVAGAGGIFETSAAEIAGGSDGDGFDGVINGAGLGMLVWPGFFSSAKSRRATRHCGRATGAINLAAGRTRNSETRNMMSCAQEGRRMGEMSWESCVKLLDRMLKLQGRSGHVRRADSGRAVEMPQHHTTSYHHHHHHPIFTSFTQS